LQVRFRYQIVRWSLTLGRYAVYMSVEGVNAHPIDRAQSCIGEQPLLAADLALIALGTTKGYRSEPETQHYLEVLARAVVGASSCPEPGSGDPVKAMFEHGRCDSLACASLLRLLVLDEDVFVEERVRPAIALFDRVLAARLYKSIGLTARSQAFDKRARLRNAVDEHERAIQAHVDSLGSLAALAPFRQQLSSLFKDQLSQLVLRPFLPRVTIQTLNEVLGAVQAVTDAGDDEILERAETALARCGELSAGAAETGTSYARSLVGALSGTLQDLVRTEVRARGLADPASITVLAQAKAYPLAHVGSSVILRLDIVNDGPGHARDVELTIEGHQAIDFEDTSRSLGIVAPGRRRLNVLGQVNEASTSEVVLARVSWRDPDGSVREHERLIDLLSQKSTIDWDLLEYEDPYPLEAVTEAERFVGRDSVLRDLAKVLFAASPGNARIQGQKRVGKTSVANALAARVEFLRPGVYTFISLQSGDFNANTAEETVERLGQMIAEQVVLSDPRLSGILRPDFGSGLSPLTEVFARASATAPERRFVVVLDEFDAMPHPELYQHGPIGTAFFQTLRSLGSKRNVAFILIGGERMRFVISTHGQALNRFQLVPVDYFDDEHYQDYIQLLRTPVDGWVDIEDGAVRALHAATAGNPWLTKSIARELFDHHRANRDAVVTSDDMKDAIATAIPRLSATSFQHFWDDAIQGDEADQQLVSVMRRKILLAIATCIRARTPLTEEAVTRAARRYDVDVNSAVDVLRGFRERSILFAGSDGTLTFRIPLFGQWLENEGVREIVVTMGDDDSLIRRQRAEEASRPRAQELEELAKRWRSYGGQLLDAERAKRWLQQFGQPRDQRLMLRLLQSLRFYNHNDVRERLRNMHEYVIRDLAASGHEYRRTGQQRSRDDLLICGLEGGGSGAGHLVKPYRDENRIYAECAVDAAAVPQALVAGAGNVAAVVVLEDFVATGATAQDRLKQLHRLWTAEAPWPAGVAIYLVAVCGFDAAVERVRGGVDTTDFPIHVHVADHLDQRDRCFGPESIVFPEEADRERARAIAYELGASLEPKHPLGYEDSQALVCFEARCPNNTLPILWKNGPSWEALFPRL
jgi:hypothetical protein